MKFWIVSLSLFTASLLSSPSSYAQEEVTLLEGSFVFNARIKNTDTTPATVTQVFSFPGTAFFIDNKDPRITDSGQITIRRQTFNCFRISNYTSFRCDFEAQNFPAILDEIGTHDADFLRLKEIVNNYYDNNYRYRYFSFDLGTKNQRGIDSKVTKMIDPKNKNLTAEFEVIYSGMRPL